MNSNVKIEADKFVAQVDSGEIVPPSSWESRAIYRGKMGASNWLAVVSEPNYPLRIPDKLGLQEMRIDAIKDLGIATMVSLGPGDGCSDANLIEALQCQSAERDATRQVKYIPVDISRALLKTAIAAVEPFAEIPVGVHCDFEEGKKFLAEILGQYATDPKLFTLLGGTFGNLDRGLRSFIEGLRRLMGPGDTFLVDVPLAAHAWNAEDEPRLKLETYTTAFRHFLAGGLIQPDASPTASVVDLDSDTAFKEHLTLTLRHDPETDAEEISVVDRSSGHRILKFWRYRWEPIQRWFEDHGFRVRFARSSVTSKKDKFGMGVLVLEHH